MAEYVALAVVIAGAGYSAYSSHQQGKAANNAARYNAVLQMQQANAARGQQNMQARAALQQSQMMQQQAAANNAFAQAEAQARINNAQQLRQRAEVEATNQQENMRKQRGDMERMQALQRAKIAGSGVVESGSPLELMAETAGEMEQSLNESHYQTNLTRSQSMAEAALEEFGGNLMSAQGMMDQSSMNAQAALTRYGGEAERMKGESMYRAGRMQSSITRMVGADAQRAGNMQAVGSLLSGLGTAGGQWVDWTYRNPNTSNVTSLSGYGKSVATKPYGI
jgi:hypothetical protein